MWTLRIDKASPSQNAFAFSHWRKAKASKDAWKMLIRCAKGFLEVPKATGKRRLTIERHSSGLLDEQNLIGGAKGIIDNLVQLGLLVDDRPELLELHAKQVKSSRAGAHTLLILEEVA
jgi:hypothetical protein